MTRLIWVPQVTIHKAKLSTISFLYERIISLQKFLMNPVLETYCIEEKREFLKEYYVSNAYLVT